MQHREYSPLVTVAGVPLSIPATAAVGQPVDRYDSEEDLPQHHALGRIAHGRIASALGLAPTRFEGSRGIWFGAARSGNLNSLRATLEGGKIKVNARGDWGYTALHFATQHRHTEAVALLLSAGADPSPVDRGLNKCARARVHAAPLTIRCVCASTPDARH